MRIPVNKNQKMPPNKKRRIALEANEAKDGKDAKESQEVNKEGLNTDADVLFDPLQATVLEYLGEYKTDPNTYKYQSRLTLLGNITALYSQQIAHNLLWHIDVNNTLELAKQYPSSLLIPVEIKDPHGQRVRGTPLQIIAAAGDYNTRKMKPEEKNYGLVERLRPCFPNPDDFDQQLKQWFEPDSEKQITNKLMAPYVSALITLGREIITSQELLTPEPPSGMHYSRYPEFFLESLRAPSVAKLRTKFIEALTPDPNHVVTSGFLFDLQIFIDFEEIWEAFATNSKVGDKERPNLRPFNHKEGTLFAAIAFPALQARVQRIDLEILIHGISSVIDGEIPQSIDFSKGIPKDLNGLGDNFYLNHMKGKRSLNEIDSMRAFRAKSQPVVSKEDRRFVKQKHQRWMHLISKPSNKEPKYKM